MEYAVIRTGGKQYRVAMGDILEIDKLPVEKDSTVTFDDILLHVVEGKVAVGGPKLADVKVRAKVLDQVKGEKIRVAKFKSKVRYRRVTGFRAQLTKVQIEKIDTGKFGQPKVTTPATKSSNKPSTKAPINRSRPKKKE